MFSLLLTLLRHRATWRFLVVLGGALGFASLADPLGDLEVSICSILTCLD